MAEVVGLVASIVEITGAAARLSLGLYQIARTLKRAGQEVRAVADDTSHLSRVLEELAKTLSEQAPAVKRARAVAEDVIHTCQKIQEDGEILLGILQPLVAHRKGSYRRIILSVRWLFEKSKFTYHRDLLQSLKTTLQLLVSVIALQTTPDRHMYDRLMFQVSSLRETVESGLHNMERRLESPQSLNVFALPHQSSGNIIGLDQHQAIDNRASSNLEIAEVDDNDDAEIESQNMVLVTSRSATQSDEVDPTKHAQNDEPDADETSSSTLVGPMALVPYYRAYFVQEKVCRFVGNILETAEFDPENVLTTSAQIGAEISPILSTSSTSPEVRVSPDHTVPNKPTFTTPLTNPITPNRTSNISVSYVAEQPKKGSRKSEGTAPQSLQSSSPDSARTIHDYTMQGPRTTTQSEFGTPPIPVYNNTSHINQANNALDTLIGQPTPQARQPYSATIPQSGTLPNISPSLVQLINEPIAETEIKDPDVIKLYDFTGVRLQIPFRECQTYDELLNSIFKYAYKPFVDSPFWLGRIKSAFDRGMLYIYEGNPDHRTKGKFIHPKDWQQTVRPNQTFNVLFVDMELGSKFDSRAAALRPQTRRKANAARLNQDINERHTKREIGSKSDDRSKPLRLPIRPKSRPTEAINSKKSSLMKVLGWDGSL